MEQDCSGDGGAVAWRVVTEIAINDDKDEFVAFLQVSDDERMVSDDYNPAQIYQLESLFKHASHM